MWIGSMQTSASTAVDSSASRCSWLLTWTQGDRLRSSCDALCLHWDAGCHHPHPRDVSRMMGKLNKGQKVCYFQSLKTGYYFSRRGQPHKQSSPSLVWWDSLVDEHLLPKFQKWSNPGRVPEPREKHGYWYMIWNPGDCGVYSSLLLT